MAETCFPVEVMHGHVRDLFERNPDFVFLPFIVDTAGEKDNPTCNYNCPWIEAYPFMVRAALEDERERDEAPGADAALPLRPGSVERQLAEALAGPLGVDRRRVHRAVRRGGEGAARLPRSRAPGGGRGARRPCPRGAGPW